MKEMMKHEHKWWSNENVIANNMMRDSFKMCRVLGTPICCHLDGDNDDKPLVLGFRNFEKTSNGKWHWRQNAWSWLARLLWTNSLVGHSQPGTLVDEAALGGGELEGPQEVGDLPTATLWSCFPRIEKRCGKEMHPTPWPAWSLGRRCRSRGWCPPLRGCRALFATTCGSNGTLILQILQRFEMKKGNLNTWAGVKTCRISVGHATCPGSQRWCRWSSEGCAACWPSLANGQRVIMHYTRRLWLSNFLWHSLTFSDFLSWWPCRSRACRSAPSRSSGKGSRRSRKAAPASACSGLVCSPQEFTEPLSIFLVQKVRVIKWLEDTSWGAPTFKNTPLWSCFKRKSCKTFLRSAGRQIYCWGVLTAKQVIWGLPTGISRTYCKILQSVILIGKIIKMMDELVDFGVSYFLDKSILVSSDHIFNGPGATFLCSRHVQRPVLGFGLILMIPAMRTTKSSLAWLQGFPSILGSQNYDRSGSKLVDDRMTCSPLWMDDNIDKYW